MVLHLLTGQLVRAPQLKDAMSVHTQDGSLKVRAMIFEARYEAGFRYLDHAGELLVKIREKHPSWVVVGIGPLAATLYQQESRLTCGIGIEKIDVSTAESLTLVDAERTSRALGEAAECLYNLTVEVLKTPRTIRVGARFSILAPSDSLEEADRFVFKGTGSPLLDAILEKTKAEPREGQLAYVLDDPKSRHRRLVKLFSIVMDHKPEDPPYTGLPGDRGSGGVMVDIDTYTRPEVGHQGKVSTFVQESFLKSRELTKGILGWLLTRQK